MVQSWLYFLSLERDFIRTSDYVAISSDNRATYSNEYAKLLLLIGSEVDVRCKALCRSVHSSSEADGIGRYRQELCSAFQGMHAIEIEISRFAMTVRPWASWAKANRPIWWDAYNNIKHKRDACFDEANQQNVLEALCGLLAIHLYLHRDSPHLQPYPEVLEYGFPSYLVTSGRKALPGYVRAG